MGLKVGHEHQSNGSWSMLELKNNNASHLKAIVVGNKDFLMTGTQREIVKWLTSFDKPIKCSPGFGNEVWVILRNVSPKISEVMRQAYGSALGIGGVGSLVFHGFAAFSTAANTAAQAAPSGELASAAAGAVFNMSDNNFDSVLSSVIDKLVGKKVTVRLSSSKGAYAAKVAQSSTVKIPSGLTSRYCAGVLSTLSW